MARRKLVYGAIMCVLIGMFLFTICLVNTI